MKISKIKRCEYPFLLQQVPRIPEEMEILGEMPSDKNKFLCVVGSRTNSEYGRETCFKLISGLRGYPIVIVSGMAIGIDSLAHEAALKSGLKTIAFPGSGLAFDSLHPKSRRDLARRIVQSGGALVSPFERQQAGTLWTFPNRNRLMAGISNAVMIIEARQHSGTLLTAEHATNLHREIYVVMGSMFSDLSYGPNMLLRRGATPIASSEDILEALGFPVIRKDGMTAALPNFSEMSLTKDQREIIDCLRIEPLSATDLIAKTRFSSHKFNTLASELELLGLIKEVQGRYRIY